MKQMATVIDDDGHDACCSPKFAAPLAKMRSPPRAQRRGPLHPRSPRAVSSAASSPQPASLDYGQKNDAPPALDGQRKDHHPERDGCFFKGKARGHYATRTTAWKRHDRTTAREASAPVGHLRVATPVQTFRHTRLLFSASESRSIRRRLFLARLPASRDNACEQQRVLEVQT